MRNFIGEVKEIAMKVNEKLNISFSTVKPYLLMVLFALCVLNAGIVRADENHNSETNIIVTNTAIIELL